MKITFCVLRLSLLGLLAQVDANQGTKNLYGGYCRSRIHPDQRRFVCIESDDGPLDLEEGSVSSWYYLDPSDATRMAVAFDNDKSVFRYYTKKRSIRIAPTDDGCFAVEINARDKTIVNFTNINACNGETIRIPSL